MNKHSPRLMRKSRARHLGMRFSHKVKPAGSKIARRCANKTFTTR